RADRRRGAAPPDGKHRPRARAGRGGHPPAGARSRGRDHGVRALARGGTHRGRAIAPAHLEAAAGTFGADAVDPRGAGPGRARRRDGRGGGGAVSLRGKLLLAQAPLAVALALVGVLSASVTNRLAGQSRLILADNYRSVLAAERMKE